MGGNMSAKYKDSKEKKSMNLANKITQDVKLDYLSNPKNSNEKAKERFRRPLYHMTDHSRK